MIKTCKSCGAELTEDSRYKDESKSRAYCIECYKAKRRDDYKKCTKIVYLTIGEEYPKYRLNSKNTSDAVASFSKEVVRPALWWTPYIGLDVLIGAVPYSEFDQFKVDRLLMKHLGREAHEPAPQKTGKPVYTIILSSHEGRYLTEERLHCKYCGHDAIVYDERGFKYDTESAWVPKMATDYYTGNFHTKYIVTKAVAKKVCVAEWFKIEPERDQDLVNAVDLTPPVAEDGPCLRFNDEGLLVRGCDKDTPFIRKLKTEYGGTRMAF
jgi:hypothetical protein